MGKEYSVNRQARHDYFIESTYEAGISLTGPEVKSIRASHVNLKGSWCSFDNGELFVNSMHISPYTEGSWCNTDPMRKRKLLLHRTELNKIFKQTDKQAGLTIVPLKVYDNHGKIKVEIGVCKGKHNYDKREALKKRDIERDMRRVSR